MTNVMGLDAFKKLMELRGFDVREHEGRVSVVDEIGMVIASSVKWQVDDHIFVARHPFKELLEGTAMEERNESV